MIAVKFHYRRAVKTSPIQPEIDHSTHQLVAIHQPHPHAAP